MIGKKLKLKGTELFFLALVLYLPFQIALNLTAGFDILSGRIFIPILFIIWWLKLESNKKFSWLANETTLALALFFLINLLSVSWAQNQFWAGRKILVFASIFPLFILTKEIVISRGLARKMLKVMILGAAAAALIALAQFLSQWVFGREQIVSFWSQKILPWFSGQTFGNLVAQNPSWLVEIQGKSFWRAFGLFPDPHMLAFFLGLIFPFVLTLFFFGKKQNFLLFAICCLLFVVSALTFSRGGYLGFFAAFLIIIFFIWPRISFEAKRVLKNGALVLLILFFLAGGLISARFFSSFNLNEGSNQGRLAIWQESFNVFLENPILGVGLGNYPLTTDPYVDYRSPVTSHNLYLDILAETGIFGLLAWLWFIVAAAKAAWRKIKSVQKEDWIVGLGTLGALVYFSVHSFFETAIFNPTVLAFLMIVCGLAASQIRADRPIATKNHNQM